MNDRTVTKSKEIAVETETPSNQTDKTVTIKDGLALYKDSLSDAESDLKALGLGTPSRPTDRNGEYFDGHLPADIANSSVSKIAEVMTLMTVFADYVASLRVRAKAEKQNAEEKLKLIKAKIRTRKTGTKEVKDDLTISDVRFVVANSELLQKIHTFEAILAREEAARRDIKTLSRLIEKERVSFEGNRRASNATSYPKKRFK